MPRFAASVALRIASGTSRALPWPKPTRPFWSPTTTSAAKPKRRPPFTTLATRLMWTSLSTIPPSRSSPPFPLATTVVPAAMPVSVGSVFRAIGVPLKLQSAFTRGVGQRLDAPVKQISAAIEYDLLHAFFLRTFGDQLADRLCGINVRAGLAARAHFLLHAGRRGDRHALRVVDHLRVDVLRRAEYGQPRPAAAVRFSARRTRPRPAKCDRPSILAMAIRHFFLPSLRKMCLVGVLHALAFVRLRRTEPRISAATWPTFCLSMPVTTISRRLSAFDLMPSGIA